MPRLVYGAELLDLGAQMFDDLQYLRIGIQAPRVADVETALRFNKKASEVGGAGRGDRSWLSIQGQYPFQQFKLCKVPPKTGTSQMFLHRV